MSAVERSHAIKAWPRFYAAVDSGAKRFEIRRNDRGFAVGDSLLIQEFDPERQAYTGRETARVVTYVTDFEQQPGFVVMGIAPPASEGRDVWLFKAVREGRGGRESEEVDADVEVCDTIDEVTEAVWVAVFSARDTDPDHAAEVADIVAVLVKLGAYTFEGDPPLELERVHLFARPPVATPR